MAEYHLAPPVRQRLVNAPETGHNRWHPDIPPALEVESGDEILVDCRDGVDGQILPTSTDADLKDVDPQVTDQTKRTYAAMVRAMDRNVGLILAELDRQGLRENTIVVFTSDNGATKDGSNLPFRGGKHSVNEGGTHLPAVVSWPKGGLTKRSWDGLCGALDLFPSLMAMAGLEMPTTRPLDGKNLWPALRDGAASPVESYYWSWHDADTIRTADWRLHRRFGRNELFAIREDVGETKNLASSRPEVVKDLTAKMDAWAGSLGAALSHLPSPARLDAKPAPEGEVLEVTVNVTAQAKPKDRLIIPLAGFEGFQLATDYVEYDVAVAADSLPGGFYYAPLKGNDPQTIAILFKRGEGIALGHGAILSGACNRAGIQACFRSNTAHGRGLSSWGWGSNGGRLWCGGHGRGGGWRSGGSACGYPAKQGAGQDGFALRREDFT